LFPAIKTKRASDMPDSAVLTFTDLDAYHAAMPGAHAEGVVTARGYFRAESTTIRLDRLDLHRTEESLPRTVYSAVDPELFGIIFATDPSQLVHINGLELSQSDVPRNSGARSRPATRRAGS
jgi:hypothetical protein